MNKSIISNFANYGFFLTSRHGDFIGSSEGAGEATRIGQLFEERYSYDVPFDETTKKFVFAEGDPRRYMGEEEMSFVIVRNGKLGILAEGEMDIAAGDESSDGLTRDRNGTLVVSPQQMAEAANHWLGKLAPLASEYPLTEFFVSHGEVAYDGRLQVNAFTPLFERDGKFYSPYEDDAKIGQLDGRIASMIYEPTGCDAFRIYRQLVMTTVDIKPVETLLRDAIGESRAAEVMQQGDYEMISVLVRKHGPNETCALLNQVLGTSLNIGNYVLASLQEKGMWCNDFGWVDDRDAATGYSQETAEAGVSMIAALDAEFVRYDDVQQYFAINKKAA